MLQLALMLMIAQDVGTLALDGLRIPADAKPPVLRNVGEVRRPNIEWSNPESTHEGH